MDDATAAVEDEAEGPLTINYCGLLKKAQLHYAMSVRSRSGLDIGPRVSVPVPGHSALILDKLPQLYDSTHLAGTHSFREKSINSIWLVYDIHCLGWLYAERAERLTN